MRAGASTEQLDTAARELATIHHAYPSPLNFRGFPRSISTSGHTQILIHSIPALVLVPYWSVNRQYQCNGIYHFIATAYTLHFSVNNVAGHGIPDARELQEGDILNIDVTVFLDGFHGDCSATIPVGQVDDHALKLIQVGWSGQSEIRDQAAV